MLPLMGIGGARALSWAVTHPAPQGEAVQCSGDSAIAYPGPTSCPEKSLPDAVQLGSQGQAWPSNLPRLAGSDTVSLKHFLLEWKKKSALKIESKLQMVGTEGSIPQWPIVRDVSE